MARKRYKPEEIVAKLRQVDVLVSQGQNMADAIRQIGVSEVTTTTRACPMAASP
jgi:putative transposase